MLLSRSTGDNFENFLLKNKEHESFFVRIDGRTIVHLFIQQKSFVTTGAFGVNVIGNYEEMMLTVWKRKNRAKDAFKNYYLAFKASASKNNSEILKWRWPYQYGGTDTKQFISFLRKQLAINLALVFSETTYLLNASALIREFASECIRAVPSFDLSTEELIKDGVALIKDWTALESFVDSLIEKDYTDICFVNRNHKDYWTLTFIPNKEGFCEFPIIIQNADHLFAGFHPPSIVLWVDSVGDYLDRISREFKQFHKLGFTISEMMLSNNKNVREAANALSLLGGSLEK